MPDYKMGRDWWKAERFLSPGSLLWWKCREVAFQLVFFFPLPLLANLSVIYHFLVRNTKLRFECCVSSFQLILWKAAVNIPAKKISHFKSPARQKASATEVTTAEEGWVHETLHFLLALVYFTGRDESRIKVTVQQRLGGQRVSRTEAQGGLWR